MIFGKKHNLGLIRFFSHLLTAEVVTFSGCPASSFESSMLRGGQNKLKVARTIADLGQSPYIRLEHIREAIRYRGLDRDLWTV